MRRRTEGDRLPVCQSSDCEKGLRWLNLPTANLDMRFTLAICQELDMHERTAWRLTVERQAIDIRSLANKMTMSGAKERNPNDEREIQQRKAEIEAIPPEDWLRMGDEYKYGKKDNDD